MKIILFIFASFILFVPFCKTKAQTGEPNYDKLWQTLKIKKEQIEQEINQNESSWEGEYRMHDNILTIAPNSGYAFLLRRAAFDYMFVIGDTRSSNGRLKLVIEPNSKWQKLSKFKNPPFRDS